MSLYEQFKLYWMNMGLTVARNAQKVATEWLTQNSKQLVWAGDKSLCVNGSMTYTLNEDRDELWVVGKPVEGNAKAKPEELRAAAFLILAPRCVKEIQEGGGEPTKELNQVATWVMAAKQTQSVELVEAVNSEPVVEPIPTTDLMESDEPDTTEEMSSPEVEQVVEAPAAVETPTVQPKEAKSAKAVKPKSDSKPTTIVKPAEADGTPEIQHLLDNQTAITRRLEAQDRTIETMASNLVEIMERLNGISTGNSIASGTPPTVTLVDLRHYVVPTEMVRSMELDGTPVDYLNWVEELDLFQKLCPDFSLTNVIPVVVGNRLTTYLKGTAILGGRRVTHWQVGEADSLNPFAGACSFAMALKRLLQMFGFNRDMYLKRAEFESFPQPVVPPSPAPQSQPVTTKADVVFERPRPATPAKVSNGAPPNQVVPITNGGGPRQRTPNW